MKFEEKPFIAIWETTQACDLACKHCRAEARPCRDQGELSTDEAKALLSSFSEATVPLVILTGGDPAKRPDLVELVKYGAELGLNMGLTPSATPLVTEELLVHLKNAGLGRLAMSLDGLTADVHDSFRGSEGSFALTIKTLEKARVLGIATQVNTTLHAKNLGDLEALAAQMGQLGVTLWSVFIMVPTGRAKLDLLPSAERIESALDQLLAISQRVPFAIKTTAAPHYRRVALMNRSDSNPPPAIGARGKQAMWVNEGRGFMFISHTGEIFPSGFLPRTCGNVRQVDPISVYRNHPIFRLLRDSDRLKGKCGVCNYRKVCGGARARAYAMTGDLMESDPLCSYVPPGYTGPVQIFAGESSRPFLPVVQS
jgi:AdoMet-dependent heme synthase